MPSHPRVSKGFTNTNYAPNPCEVVTDSMLWAFKVKQRSRLWRGGRGGLHGLHTHLRAALPCLAKGNLQLRQQSGWRTPDIKFLLQTSELEKQERGGVQACGQGAQKGGARAASHPGHCWNFLDLPGSSFCWGITPAVFTVIHLKD